MSTRRCTKRRLHLTYSKLIYQSCPPLTGVVAREQVGKGNALAAASAPINSEMANAPRSIRVDAIAGRGWPIEPARVAVTALIKSTKQKSAFVALAYARAHLIQRASKMDPRVRKDDGCEIPARSRDDIGPEGARRPCVLR